MIEINDDIECYIPLRYPNGEISDLYIISNYGDIINKKYKSSVSIYRNNKNRNQVCLSEKNKSRKEMKNGSWKKSFSLTKLVWISFKGIPNNDYDIHHIDCDPTNDSLVNLKCIDRHNHILLTRIQRSILDIDTIDSICREMCKDNWSINDICNKFNLEWNRKTYSAIYNIYKGHTYQDISSKYKFGKMKVGKIAPLAEDEVIKICEMMSVEGWTYENIMNELHIEYTYPVWKNKYYDILRKIYEKKNYKNITTKYDFVKVQRLSPRGQ